MIDEKGRLFGKINIIDFLVILLILVAAVVLGIKFLGPNDKDGGSTGPKIVYTVRVMDITPEAFEAVKAWVPGGDGKGDQLMAAGEMLPGYVVSVTSAPHTTNAIITQNESSIVLPVDRNTLDLTFTIEAHVTNAITNEVGTQEVRIGKSHIVKTQHIEFMGGVITGCEWVKATAA